MRTPPAAGTLARAWPHHLLLGHKLAVIELRSGAPLANLGITLNLDVTDPLDPTDPGDAEAALLLDGQHTRIFLDSLLRGACPADVEHLELLSEVKDGDLEIISAKIDTLDVNYYHCQAVSCRPAHDAPSGAASGARQTSSPFPAAGGTPTRTRPSVDGHGLEGPGRGPNPTAGPTPAGWVWGYHQRLDIVRVDYDTQVRTPKASALWRSRIAVTNILPTEGQTPVLSP